MSQVFQLEWLRNSCRVRDYRFYQNRGAELKEIKMEEIELWNSSFVYKQFRFKEWQKGKLPKEYMQFLRNDREEFKVNMDIKE